ncbi:MAG: glycosyltransferase [Ruminococcaceae bacterium]|nr:glycosyltransferase [Oscillospiraceae bacterium]
MEDIFLSIIIPVYNTHLYIEQCIQSLINQDIPMSDYEIICVDDGSTDGSRGILENYKKAFNNLRVYYQKNNGVSSARNHGLKLAKGRYVWFVDADDFIAPNILKQLREIARNSGADRVELESYSFDRELNFSEQEKFAEKRLTPNVAYKKVMVTRTLYKREYLVNNNILFLEGVHYGEDGLFNYQTLIHNPLTIESNILAYFYRKHNESVTGITDKAFKAQKSLDGTKYVMDVLIEHYNNNICIDETRRMLLYWMYGILENYSYLDKDYFCNNFVWSYHLKNIPLNDMELRILNRVMCNFSKSHNYDNLLSFVSKQKQKKELKEIRKNSKKKIVGYIKHPRRFLKSFFKKN